MGKRSVKQLERLLEKEKAKALFGVFDFPLDDENAQQAILALVNSKQREQALKELQVNTAAADKIIENYIAGYKKLKEDMKAHADDAVFIQSAAETLAAQYKAAFELDGVLFYQETKKSAPQIAAALEKAFPDIQQAATAQQYSSEYTALKEAMKLHSTDMTALKEDVTLIEEKYMNEFTQDYKAFFDEVKDEHPLIVYRLLMHRKTRVYLLDNDTLKKSLTTFQHIPDKEKHPQIQSYFKSCNGLCSATCLSTSPVMVLYTYKCKLSDEYIDGHQWHGRIIASENTNNDFILANKLFYHSEDKNGKVIYLLV